MSNQYELLEDGKAVNKETGEIFMPEYIGEFTDKELREIDESALHGMRAEAKTEREQRFLLILWIVLASIGTLIVFLFDYFF